MHSSHGYSNRQGKQGKPPMQSAMRAGLSVQELKAMTAMRLAQEQAAAQSQLTAQRYPQIQQQSAHYPPNAFNNQPNPANVQQISSQNRTRAQRSMIPKSQQGMREVHIETQQVYGGDGIRRTPTVHRDQYGQILSVQDIKELTRIRLAREAGSTETSFESDAFSSVTLPYSRSSSSSPDSEMDEAEMIYAYQHPYAQAQGQGGSYQYDTKIRQGLVMGPRGVSPEISMRRDEYPDEYHEKLLIAEQRIRQNASAAASASMGMGESEIQEYGAVLGPDKYAPGPGRETARDLDQAVHEAYLRQNMRHLSRSSHDFREEYSVPPDFQDPYLRLPIDPHSLTAQQQLYLKQKHQHMLMTQQQQLQQQHGYTNSSHLLNTIDQFPPTARTGRPPLPGHAQSGFDHHSVRSESAQSRTSSQGSIGSSSNASGSGGLGSGQALSNPSSNSSRSSPSPIASDLQIPSGYDGRHAPGTDGGYGLQLPFDVPSGFTGNAALERAEAEFYSSQNRLGIPPALPPRAPLPYEYSSSAAMQGRGFGHGGVNGGHRLGGDTDGLGLGPRSHDGSGMPAGFRKDVTSMMSRDSDTDPFDTRSAYLGIPERDELTPRNHVPPSVGFGGGSGVTDQFGLTLGPSVAVSGNTGGTVAAGPKQSPVALSTSRSRSRTSSSSSSSGHDSAFNASPLSPPSSPKSFRHKSKLQLPCPEPLRTRSMSDSNPLASEMAEAVLDALAPNSPSNGGSIRHKQVAVQRAPSSLLRASYDHTTDDIDLTDHAQQKSEPQAPPGLALTGGGGSLAGLMERMNLSELRPTHIATDGIASDFGISSSLNFGLGVGGNSVGSGSLGFGGSAAEDSFMFSDRVVVGTSRGFTGSANSGVTTVADKMSSQHTTPSFDLMGPSHLGSNGHGFSLSGDSSYASVGSSALPPGFSHADEIGLRFGGDSMGLSFGYTQPQDQGSAGGQVPLDEHEKVVERRP